MDKIRFVTDSAADIPSPLQKELDIQVLPFPIVMNGKEYQDGVDFTPEEFYAALLSAPKIPTHAQLTPFVFDDCYAQAYEQGYTHLIYTCINAKGSATYQNALQSRDYFYDHNPEARDKFHIVVIDSKTYTMGYGYAVLEGARRAKAGASAQEVVDFIQDWVDHSRLLFCVFDLKFAKKSGRVSAAAAFVGEALGLKPIMTFENGDSKILTKVRGERNVLPTIIDMCRDLRQEGTPYQIIRGNNDAQAQRFAQELEKALGEPPEMVYPIGGVIAINAGPNLAGIAFRQKDKN